MFVVQVLFFIAVAFGSGCLFGCWLKGRSASGRHHSGAAAAITHEGAARTVTASELAAPMPHYEPASSPSRASASTARPDPVAATAPADAVAPAMAAPVPASKPAKPRAIKSTTAKPAASKATAPKTVASKPRTAKAPDAGTTKAAKPPAAKAKAVKAKPVAAATPDNLKKIKGIGPALEARLNAAGVNSFAQIAAWTKKEQVSFAEQLSFAGRIEREEWVSQAKVLAKGGATEFSQRVAKGEVASSADGKPRRGGKT